MDETLLRDQLRQLRLMAQQVTSEEEAREVTSKIAHITRQIRIQRGLGLPLTPVEQAKEIDGDAYRERPHLTYLGERIAEAVRDVERGQNRRLVISMPPRAGKSYLVNRHTPIWLLRRHPEWDIISASYDGGLTNEWAREVRTIIEEQPNLGIALKKDGGAGGRWETLEGGHMFATAIRGSATGRGARVFLIDDPVKDFIEAHSAKSRQMVWDWWLSVAQTRLTAPYLVIVVMTRWHEDDFVGRLLSEEYDGLPSDWEPIIIPAIAGENDLLGRSPGEPLLSPATDETTEQAIYRWNEVRQSSGSYMFSSMYQQQPAPAKGAIFDASWWKFWTSDPSKAKDDGSVIYVEPSTFTGGRWLDSWDCAFKGGDSRMSSEKGTDYVVGQRWVRHNANRYLIAQQRGRWSFTQTIDKMNVWAETTDTVRSPQGHLVHERLIEDKANGSAIIDSLKEHVAGIKPVNPRVSKESRARAITPEIESGNVYLPNPTDPGNEWVADLMSELRNFPHDAHDDQVDALTQALSELRNAGRGRLSVPGRSPGTRPTPGVPGSMPRNIARTAQTGRGFRR